MTREETIKYMESWENHMFDNGGIEEAEAFHMAIEALEAQEKKCETCVSRRGLYCPKLQRTTSDTFFCAYWKE